MFLFIYEVYVMCIYVYPPVQIRTIISILFGLLAGDYISMELTQPVAQIFDNTIEYMNGASNSTVWPGTSV